MQLMLAQKCAECRPDAFQMQVPTPTLQNAAGGWFWAVLAVFCGDFDRAVSWFAAPGLVGLLDVRVLDVWMFRFLPGKRLFGCLSFVFFC